MPFGYTHYRNLPLLRSNGPPWRTASLKRYFFAYLTVAFLKKVVLDEVIFQSTLEYPMAMDAEDWRDAIIESLLESFENGDLNYDREQLEPMIIEFINSKYENDELDEDIRDELVENSSEIAEILASEFGSLVDEEEETDES
jgi:hypothetical protein